MNRIIVEFDESRILIKRQTTLPDRITLCVYFWISAAVFFLFLYTALTVRAAPPHALIFRVSLSALAMFIGFILMLAVGTSYIIAIDTAAKTYTIAFGIIPFRWTRVSTLGDFKSVKLAAAGTVLARLCWTRRSLPLIRSILLAESTDTGCAEELGRLAEQLDLPLYKDPTFLRLARGCGAQTR